MELPTRPRTMMVKMLLFASALATGIAAAGVAAIYDGPVVVGFVIAVLAGGMAYAWPLSWRDYVHGAKTMLPLAVISSLVALPPVDISYFVTLLLLLLTGFLFAGFVGKMQLSKKDEEAADGKE